MNRLQQTVANPGGDEFQLTSKDFGTISRMVHQHAGIVLADSKRSMVYARLAKRIRALGLDSFAAYLARIEADPEGEMTPFINALTTNLTSFFREAHHFERLHAEVLPRLREQRRHDKRLRIWSAAASTGQEPYSIAMVMAKFARENPGWDIRILATDIDSNVLETARAGVYDTEQVEPVPAMYRPFIRAGEGEHRGRVTMAPELRALLAFKRLNLLEPWPMRGPFDVVFCRNVIIYFDGPTKTRVMQRIAELLALDGELFIGHSESLHHLGDVLRLCGKSAYCRVVQ